MTLSETSPEVVVIGGGLAGLAAAVALSSVGCRVELFERRPYLGGRASSYELPGTQETIDNCQHVLLGCCTNLLDFYARLGVSHLIGFHDRIPFVTRGGRASVLFADNRPPPLHLLRSLRAFHALTWPDKLAICAGMAALSFELGMVPRERLDSETMLSWLQRHWQTRRAIDLFWRVVLTSALNEDLERNSAWHGLQVFWKGFLMNHRACRVGVPVAPLGELYRLELPGVRVHLRAHARSLDVSAGRVRGVCFGHGVPAAARWVVIALPFENAQELLPGDYSAFSHSPIVGIHLWFDRPVMEEPFAALVGGTIQWAFRKPGDSGYVQCVVSAARALLPLGRKEIVEMAVRELAEFFPLRGARLRKWAVVKEVRATYSPAAGLERLRPPNATQLENCFLAGDWVETGWPPTMEGAVRSGYRAAELVTARAGRPHRFLQPDLEPEGLARWAPAARVRS